MVLIEVENNPNCQGAPQMSYAELEKARPILQVRLERRGVDQDCWIVGLEEGGKLCPAYAQKVTDSGAGYAYLIYGGSWGLRLQLQDPAAHPWNLSDPAQWGEAYLLLAEESDLVIKQKEVA